MSLIFKQHAYKHVSQSTVPFANGLVVAGLPIRTLG